jgi:hypothetical protein
MSQIAGIITLRINNTVIFTYTNTTPFTNGNIMLGYDDAFDSIGTGGGGLVIYDNVRVVTVAPPAIVGQPTNVIAGVGTNATFAVTISPTATGVTNYQWRLNGTPISGATTNPYTFGVLASSFGTYSVVVDDGYYTNVSAGATLKPPLPVIITQPANRVTPVNTATNLSVVAQTFSGVTNYQWFFNNATLSGTTTNPFNLTVRSTNYGSFKVTVSDGQNPTITSSVATIFPPATASIATQPTSRAGAPGGSATFTSLGNTASGITNYQWQLYGTNLAGKTAATLALSNLQGSNYGPYQVTVNDGFNPAVTSLTAQLTVAVNPNIANSLIGSSFKMTFPTEVGPGYVVEYKTNLTDATWKGLSTNIGNGSPVTITDSITNAPTRFYRVRMQ